jgi:hypothetical protein
LQYWEGGNNIMQLMKKIILEDKWDINNREYKFRFPPYAWKRLYDIYFLDGPISYNFKNNFGCLYSSTDKELTLFTQPDFKLVGNNFLQIMIILMWME